ncbi:hypothetical protein HD554DRAFT_2046551 [Boletus coccyginus]|nr:hypothetical protein HD554DRAFT_2046551 [Boletus coccyginus]
MKTSTISLLPNSPPLPSHMGSLITHRCHRRFLRIMHLYRWRSYSHLASSSLSSPCPRPMSRWHTKQPQRPSNPLWHTPPPCNPLQPCRCPSPPQHPHPHPPLPCNPRQPCKCPSPPRHLPPTNRSHPPRHRCPNPNPHPTAHHSHPRPSPPTPSSHRPRSSTSTSTIPAPHLTRCGPASPNFTGLPVLITRFDDRTSTSLTALAERPLPPQCRCRYPRPRRGRCGCPRRDQGRCRCLRRDQGRCGCPRQDRDQD